MDNKYIFLILLFLGIIICFFMKYLNVIENMESCDSSKPKVYENKSNSCKSTTDEELQLLNEEYTKELNELKNRISKIKNDIVIVEKNQKDIDNAANSLGGDSKSKDDVIPTENEVKNEERSKRNDAKRESRNAGSNYDADRF